MVEKKTKPNKSIAKKAIKQKPKAVVQNQEKLYSANEIADVLHVPSFEFYIMKKKYNINDGALLTFSQFREMYKQAMTGR